MPPARDAILQLPARGGVEAALLRDVMGATHDAHSGFIALDRLVHDVARFDRREPPWLRPYLSRPGVPYVNWVRPGLADSFVFAEELLVVSRVELASPGFLEFVGSLNPLE